MLIAKRQYEIKKDKRTFLDFLPPVSIFLAGLTFIIGTGIAIWWYETPNGKYQFLSQFFSELGVRKTFNDGGVIRYAPMFPDIFNMTLVATGVLMFPFFMFTFRQMRNENRLSNFFLLIAMIIGILAGFMLMGVGVFDLSYDKAMSNPPIYVTHGFYVSLTYLFMAIVSIFWLLCIMTSKNLPYHKTKWIILDYIFVIILVINALVNILDGIKLLPVDNIPYLRQYPIEFYQKLMAYLFFVYYGLVVGVRLSLKKYDNTPVIDTSRIEAMMANA